jgi:formylmethanofuran dehydrogenase subunit A
MYDLIINNVKIVRPNQTTVERADIAIKDGKIAMGWQKKFLKEKIISPFPVWWMHTCIRVSIIPCMKMQ